MNDPIGLLGLAMRSRNVISGEEVIKRIQKKRAYLVIIANDCGENTRKKLIDKCTFYEVPVVFMDSDTLNHAIGMRNRKAIAIVNEGFAQKLHACLKG